jgi:hypothetical protein
MADRNRRCEWLGVQSRELLRWVQQWDVGPENVGEWWGLWLIKWNDLMN